ncbi:MAG: ATP-binding protein [Chloroflexota bacterium]
MGKQVLTVPGRLQEVRRVCQFMREGAREAGFGEDTLFQIELACDEAVTNIVEHAYGGEGVGEIEASYRMDGDLFVMVLRDNGRSFDPNAVPAPPIPNQENLDELQLGGLGLHFIRNLMDDVQFTSDAKRGNKLMMIKKRPFVS